MDKILITGGLGYIGGRLSRFLSKEYDVVSSSRRTALITAKSLYNNIQIIDHSKVLSKDTFPPGIRTIIHLAALNEWDCVKYPSEAIKVNIDETRGILENAIAHEVDHFIYFSTAHVYGPLTGHIHEDKITMAVHPYAITHKAAEDYVLAASRQNKIHGIVLRLSNAYGAPIDPQVNRWTLLANDLCRQAIETHQLTLSSNGCQYRDFITLSDVESVIYQLLKKGPDQYTKQIYNVGSGKSMKVIDMATAIAELYKKQYGQVIAIELPDNTVSTEEPELQFSIDRLVSEGIKIENPVQDELQGLLNFCFEHFNIEKKI